MNTLEDFLMTRPPTANRPLLGQTVLTVEDSRYACEAMRLLCLKSGARIRRADSLGHARRHLRVYRPNIVVIDLGLPDGSGAELIAELANASPRIDVILGTSGDPGAAEEAAAAGADGFLEKPVANLGAFQAAVLSHLPQDRQPRGPRILSEERVEPDPLALRDDFAHAATLLDDMTGETAAPGIGPYVSQFLGAIARSSEDAKLGKAVRTARLEHDGGEIDVAALRSLRDEVADRLAACQAI